MAKKETVDIDGNALVRDLEDYFGSGMMSTGSPLAMMELERVRRATPDELIEIAESNGFDPMDYEIR